MLLDYGLHHQNSQQYAPTQSDGQPEAAYTEEEPAQSPPRWNAY